VNICLQLTLRSLLNGWGIPMGPLVVALNYLLGGINIDIEKITELQASGYKYAVWPYHIPQSNRTAVCCSSRTCKSLRIRWTGTWTRNLWAKSSGVPKSHLHRSIYSLFVGKHLCYLNPINGFNTWPWN
jgi:hypothetical protein